MKRIAQILPILLALLLQAMPLLKTILAHPAAGSTCAFILRWGVGTAATVGAFDAVSAASNYFTSASNFTGNVGVFFTNKLTILSSQGDGGALCTVTAGSSVALANGQTTTLGMPSGLTLKFFDPIGGPNTLYIAISGTPTVATTNLFGVDLFYSGSPTVHGDFSIKITAGGGSTPPTITVQPVGVTNVAGSSPTFSVTAAGTAPLAYQWRLTGAAIAGATTNPFSRPQVRASQAGNYTVVITNSAGAITSSVAVLAVTNPLPRVLTSPVKSGGTFQFTFTPTVGLTNTVQSCGALDNSWTTFSNVPPPASATPVTITNAFASTNKFFRVLLQP
jgi:hypothetical protein